jgi:hypothetical protein
MSELRRTREGYLVRADELLATLDDELRPDLVIEDVQSVLYVLAVAATANANIAMAENMGTSVQSIEVTEPPWPPST